MNVQYICTQDGFRAVPVHDVELLNVHEPGNLELLHAFLLQLNDEPFTIDELRDDLPPDDGTWLEYAIVHENREIISRAAIWKKKRIAG